jgi:hypothetical protein
VVFQVGLAPLRIDVLTQITGVEFTAAWTRGIAAVFADDPVRIIGREDFIANKRATGRLKDLADVERLAVHRKPRRR